VSTVRSRKNKGKRLQNFVRDNLLELFESLEPDDIVSAIMGDTGKDIKLSPAARKLIPYSIEAKNVESLNIWKAIDQCLANTDLEKELPAVVFSKNNREVWAAIPFEHFIELIKRYKN